MGVEGVRACFSRLDPPPFPLLKRNKMVAHSVVGTETGAPGRDSKQVGLVPMPVSSTQNRHGITLQSHISQRPRPFMFAFICLRLNELARGANRAVANMFFGGKRLKAETQQQMVSSDRDQIYIF